MFKQDNELVQISGKELAVAGRDRPYQLETNWGHNPVRGWAWRAEAFLSTAGVTTVALLLGSFARWPSAGMTAALLLGSFARWPSPQLQSKRKVSPARVMVDQSNSQFDYTSGWKSDQGTMLRRRKSW